MNRPVILIANNNQDMLSFIIRQLKDNYITLTAKDGLEALEVLDDQEVTLVVSNVIMPCIDGSELCKVVKPKLNYSHIPVTLLTARTNIQSEIEGLELGTDAYIEKPFSVEYLQACVANPINSREKLRQAFAQSPFIAANTVASIKADEEFMKELNEITQGNSYNPDFSMDDIIDSLNMSCPNFYRKVERVLDPSPDEYLWLERLKQAAQLSKEGNGRVNEICYMVGFNSPFYFSKYFQKRFGVSPKDLADQIIPRTCGIYIPVALRIYTQCIGHMNPAYCVYIAYLSSFLPQYSICFHVVYEIVISLLFHLVQTCYSFFYSRYYCDLLGYLYYPKAISSVNFICTSQSKQ